MHNATAAAHARYLTLTQREADDDHAWALKVYRPGDPEIRCRVAALPADLGVGQAVTYLVKAWDMPKRGLRARLDAAIKSGVVRFARSATFGVSYTMAAGRSVGGHDAGSRPVTYDRYTRASIDAWAAGGATASPWLRGARSISAATFAATQGAKGRRDYVRAWGGDVVALPAGTDAPAGSMAVRCGDACIDRLLAAGYDVRELGGAVCVAHRPAGVAIV